MALADGARGGRNILTVAYTRLQELAAHIEDEELRRSLLDNVAANREIVTEWNRAGWGAQFCL